MAGTSEESFFPLSKHGTKSPHTKFSGRGRGRVDVWTWTILYKVQLSVPPKSISANINDVCLEMNTSSERPGY